MKYLIVWTYYGEKDSIVLTQEYATTYQECAEIVNRAFEFQVENAQTVGGLPEEQATNFLPMPQVYVTNDEPMVPIEEESLGEDFYPEPSADGYSDTEAAEIEDQLFMAYANLGNRK
jgi:hypothetical protein